MSTHRYVVLADGERARLEGLVRKGTAKARTITRARILLLSDRSRGCRGRRAPSYTIAQIADAVQCNVATVRNIRNRYFDEGLEAALIEKPRPGASLRPKVTGEVEAHLLAIARSAAPEGHTRWTLKLLADRLVELGLVDSISRDTVHRCLKRGR